MLSSTTTLHLRPRPPPVTDDHPGKFYIP
uniref:Expressed protein n=1 Tax=Oryza sativa subsp. japonica TaxID=39947 RepID=Q10LR3_ORYSJ|nr:expressed protein [Oryza sativa Japonica Group]